jgi:hypothetical protein
MNSVLFGYPYNYTKQLVDKLKEVLVTDSVQVSSESVFMNDDMLHVPYLSIYGWDGIYSCVQVE